MRAFVNMRRNWSRSAPDVIFSLMAPGRTEPLLQATRAVPIVFRSRSDPVGAGFVESLARPGGNATGFMHVRVQPELRNGWNCSSRSRPT